MRFLYLAIIVAVGGITFGTAMAATFNEPLFVNGKLQVTNGGFIFERTDNVQTAMQLKNSDKQVTFQFSDPDDLQIYIIRNTPGPNGNFEFLDFSGAEPVGRVDLAIQRSTGNVGIGLQNPSEQLDVNGNIKLSGNILSNGDICIGTCT